MSRFFSRDILIFLLISAVMLLLLGRAFHNQILEAQTMREEADDRHERTYRIPAVRGEIYDRKGNLLALSTPMVAVQVDPKKIKEALADYQQLMTLLNMNSSRFMQLVRENRDKKLSFVRTLDSEALEQKIAALKLPGVFIKNIEYTYQVGSKDNLRTISVTKSKPSLWVQESVISGYLYLFERLGKALNLPAKEIYRAVYADKDRHLYIKRQLTPDYRQKVESLHLPYVFVSNEYKRFYTNGEVNANLIGFTNIDGIGKDGLERAYDAYLQGQDGAKLVIKDVRGNVINTIKASYRPGDKASESAKGYANGGDIQLSIDQNIQYYTYKALMQVMYKHQPKSASAIVLDAKTGEILAMANVPSYHVNRGSERKGEGLRNRAVTDFIEPGSTIKPFIIAKAMDLGVIQPDSQIDTRNGVMILQGKRIKDTSRHGVLTPEGIIQKSSNVGTAKVALMMDKQQQYQLYKQLGFERESGIYFPGEVVKPLKHSDFWQPLDQASMSYGYGFNINLLNLARAYTVFANNGVLKEVSIFTKVAGAASTPPSEEARVFSPHVTQQVLQMMTKVTESGGTAVQAQIPGYQVAGKTGTSHKSSRKGGYEQNTYMSMFAGLVPASNPDMIMVVAVDEPSRGDYYGGKVAAPVFKEVMQQALRLRHIAPDMLPAEHPKIFDQPAAPFKGQIAHNGATSSSLP